MTRGAVARLVLTHLAGGLIAAATVHSVVASRASLIQTLPTALLVIVTLATGWLLAVKLPRNAIGWVLMWIAACFVQGPPVQAVGDALRDTAPGLAAWAYWIIGDGEIAWSWIPPVWALLIWIPLHFPNGQVPSSRWRWLSGCTVALLVYGSVVFGAIMPPMQGLRNPVSIPVIMQNTDLFLLVFLVTALLCFAATVASLVVRYRRGADVLRSQLRWMLWAVAVTLLLLSVSFFLPAGPTTDLVDELTLAVYGLIPVAIAIAILRYRLYEIDRIISRTAAYALVTLVVVGTYAVVVLLVGLLPALKDSGIGVALATLAAAAVFLPVLRGMRRLIDRLFNRAQYNADRVVDTFGERIRNGADPHTAGADLTAAIQQTLQPSAIGLWTPR